MSKRFHFFIFLCAALFSSSVVYSQCLSLSVTKSDVSCFDGNDGQITLTITPGTAPDAQAPFDIDFFFRASDGSLTQLALYDNVTFTSITFTPGNGSLNIPGAETFGIPSNAFIDPGSDYKIDVRSTGGGLNCRNKTAFASISSPPEIIIDALSSQNATCNGANDGQIVVDAVSGGAGAPYQYSIDGGNVFQASKNFNGLVAGTYNVVVRDGSGCESLPTPVTLTSFATVTIDNINTQNVSCNGGNDGEIIVTAVSGGDGGPYEYSIDGGVTFQSSNTFSGLTQNGYDVVVRDGTGCLSAATTINITEPALPVTGSTTQVDVLCFGESTGAIEITGSGGVAPYDFSIDGGTTYPALDAANHTFANLPQGDYDLMVRDANGCASLLIEVTINEPAAAVTGTTTKTDVLCFGASTGEIVITGSGGVAPYDFSIDGGATYTALDAANHTFANLPQGDYDLMVRDANGCASPLIGVTINEPVAAVTGTTTKADVLCFGESTGEIEITGSGGVAPYDFSIDAGTTYTVLDASNHTFLNLPQGDYDLMVRDANGCASPLIEVTINEPVAAVTGTTTKTDVLCFGGSTGEIEITGSGGVAPYDFSIDGGTTYTVLDAANHTFLNLPQGDYDLVVRDANGCASPLIEVTINEPVAAVTGSTTKTDVLCFGESTGEIEITGSGGVAPYDFSIDGGTTYPALDAANHTFANLPQGDYDLMVRDANGCASLLIEVTINEPTAAVTGTTAKTDVLCFGASTGEIVITGSGGVAPYDFSIDGGATYTALDAANHTFANLPQGDYDLMVRDANGCASPLIGVTINEPVAAVTGTTTKADVLCFGESTGEIEITGSGGVAPYDFSIDAGTTYTVLDASNHTFLNLPQGDYDLMVRDANGCASPLIEVTINEPVAAVAGSTTKTDVLCFGESTGEIEITGLGGVAPYDFSIDGGTTYTVLDAATHTFLNLAQGEYDLMVRDANGCISTLIEVTVAEPLEVTSTTTAVGATTVCSGSAGPDIIFTFTGVSPFDFTYSDGSVSTNVVDHPGTTYTIPSAGAGTYSVTALNDNNGCMSSSLGGAVIVTVEPAATVEAGTPQSICSGGSAMLSGSSFGGSAMEATWTIFSQPVNGDGSVSDPLPTNSPSSVSFTATIAGAYTLRLTSDDPAGVCEAVSDNVVITVFDNATVDADTPPPICAGGTATMSATFSGATGITWTTALGDGSFDDPSLVNAKYTPGPNDIAAGTVTLTITTVGPCAAAFEDITLTINEAPTVDAGTPQTICSSASIVLNASFGGSATGLLWSTSGDGTFDDNTDVNASYTPGPNDGVNGSVTLTATATGSCAGTFDNIVVTVNPAATVDAGDPQTACDGSAITLDATIGGSASSMTWTTSGDGTFSNNNDPDAQYTPGANDIASGTVTLTATTNNPAGPCPAVNDNVVITFNVTVTTMNANACENGAQVDLLTLVSGAPAGGSFSFTGPGVTGTTFDPSGLSGTINLTVDYDINGCTDNGTLQITVLSPSDPLCGGGNCSSVVIIPQPEPATCTNSDGRLVMSIEPATPAINNTGVKITIDGVSSTNLPISRTQFNNNVFEALPVGQYNYTIEYGDPGCVKTGMFSIDQSGTVGTPVASNIVSPACAGTATGSLTLDLPGETGNVLEWSLDAGLTDPFKPFTAGGQITGLPAGPAPTDPHVISVRRNAADVCYSSVTIPMSEAVTAVSATFNISAATCNGNDGAITNITPAGGHGGAYSFSIDGGQSFQTLAEFNGLAGGAYTLRVRDNMGCENDFAANVTFPGFINSAISKSNADCNNDGNSGAISVAVNDPGVFEVALTTDQTNPPADADYISYTSPAVTFTQLPRGEYFVYVRSGSAACPTRSAPINIFGVYDVSFGLEADCNNNQLSLALVDVTGEVGGAPLEIQISKKLSSDPPEIIYEQFPADGEVYLDYDKYAFLKTPGEYRVQVIQFQSEVVCNLPSEILDFTVPVPLNAGIGAVAESYPDVPSGKLSVVNFTGGVYPYDVRIALDSASSFSLPYHETDFEEAGLNSNQQIQMSYDEIPAGRYIVQVQDSLGCILDLTARVPLDGDLYIPNVFTPNGDGLNDVFFIRNLPQEGAANGLVISNRWGKEVFVSENYQNNWDGTGAADGIYFYRLQVADNESLTGWLEIIRGPKP